MSFRSTRLLLLVAIALAALERAGAADLVELVKKTQPSVVRIETDVSLGSGVIVGRNLVATNYHVIDGAKKVKVILHTGKWHMARGWLTAERGRDLALLEVDKLPASSAIAMPDKLPDVGLQVAALGNPEGLSFSATEGIVSGVRKGSEIAKALEAYRGLGYDMNAVWIQTSAAISHGNSGGPLVNMNGELMGLNTWCEPAGQNLNFAIAFPEIKALMTSKGQMLREFVNLPPLEPASKGKAQGELSVAMPSGRVFSFAVFHIDDDGVKNTDSVLIKHPNGVPFAAAAHANGVLNGQTVGYYDNQRLMVVVNYVDGRRHGTMKTYNEAGEPLLFAQYVKGKNHGFSCFFDERDWLLCEHVNGELKSVQLMSRGTVVTGFPSRAEAEKLADVGELFKKLDKVEAMCKANEIIFKKNVRQREEQERRARAAALGPQKRQNIQAAADRQAAEDAATIRSLYRSAYGK